MIELYMFVTRRTLLYSTPIISSSKPYLVSRMIHGENCASNYIKERWKRKIILYGTQELIMNEAKQFYECLLNENPRELVVHLQRARELAENNSHYLLLIEDMVNDAKESAIFNECFSI